MTIKSNLKLFIASLLPLAEGRARSTSHHNKIVVLSGKGNMEKIILTSKAVSVVRPIHKKFNSRAFRLGCATVRCSPEN